MIEIEFKKEAIERLLKKHNNKLSYPTQVKIQRLVDNGTQGLNPYVLSSLCKDLECLPTDILRVV